MTVRLPLLVSGLGVAQIISWASLYYPISVLGESMQRDLGVTPTLLLAAFTVSLLISSMVAPAVGRLMEARSARLVLCMGSLLGDGCPGHHGIRQQASEPVCRRHRGPPASMASAMG